MKTYSCGKEIKSTDREELGYSFSCECGKVHSTELLNQNKSLGVKQKIYSQLKGIFIWKTKTLNWLKRKRTIFLTSLKKRWRKLVPVKFVEYEEVDSRKNTTQFSYPTKKKYEKVDSRKNTTQFSYPTKKKKEFILSNKSVTSRELLKDLLVIAWHKNSVSDLEGFFLNPDRLKYLSINEAAQEMIKHAKKVAPGLRIPNLPPRVEYRLTKDNTGGYFRSDKKSKHSIVIDLQYQSNKTGSLAVLSHELCHFILQESNIKKTDLLQNEKLTDVCMFVVGFGKIFLNGFRQIEKNIQGERRKQMGYLSYDEYQEIYYDLIKIRKGNISLEKVDFEELDLNTRLANSFLGDKDKIEYNINYYRRKYPKLSIIDIKKRILIDLDRDRK